MSSGKNSETCYFFEKVEGAVLPKPTGFDTFEAKCIKMVAKSLASDSFFDAPVS